MTAVDTLGDEQVVVSPAGHEHILITVDDPTFGRIASIRLGSGQASALIEALADASFRIDPLS